MAKFQKKFKANKKSSIKKFSTNIHIIDPEKAKIELVEIRTKLAQIQDKLYAHNKYAVLICLQGMDTAGKDSLIREVFKDFNVRGVVVHSFKTPSQKELQHNYLWRHYINLPERGKFAVFNRTHYENVLITRVHPEYLLKENLPNITNTQEIPKNFWNERYKQINNFEQTIVDNGTIVLKFYLNLSKGEQKNRLLRRLKNENHNWKFSPSDLSERKLWDKYMNYYEEAIQKTSTAKAPWYLIPADDKDVCRYLVAKIILEELEKYEDIKYPELDEEINSYKNLYRKELEEEK